MVEWAVVIVGAILVAFLVKTFLVQGDPVAIHGDDLGQGDRVLVNKLSYDLHDVNRGDVIVSPAPHPLRRPRRPWT